MIKYAAALAATLAVAGAANAVTVDGSLTLAEYAGALVTVVTQQNGVDSGAQGPGNPGPFVENVGYTVYYTSDQTNVYVGLQSNGRGGLPFANLYFDTNNATSPGSDIGFEVTNNSIFVPATGARSAFTLTSLGGAFASGMTTNSDVIEVSIPWTVFMTNAAGLGQPLVAPGGSLQLRTSQSFNYAGANGDGVDAGAIPRFGFQVAPLATGSVPEPATWAMFIVGFGAIGAAMRRRTVDVSFA